MVDRRFELGILDDLGFAYAGRYCAASRLKSVFFTRAKSETHHVYRIVANAARHEST